MNAPTSLPCAGAPSFHAELLRVAASPRGTVLVCAEHGTPFEAVANLLHQQSVRSSFAFVHVRGAAARLAPSALAEALDRAGRGTFVLDEVASLPLDAQAFLARALGGREPGRGPLEARVITAVACDPEGLVARGVLREDLLYRLNGLSLRIPPLRERRAEVIALAREHLALVAPLQRLRALGFTRAAERRLAAHAWPGNDRELELTVEAALLRAGEAPIDVEHLALGEAAPALPATAVGAITLPLADRTWSTLEEALIRRVLADEGNNKSRCARVLGLHRATLHHKLKTYRIDV